MIIRTATTIDARAIAIVHVASERAAYRGIVPDVVLNALSVDARAIAWQERIQRGGSTTLLAESDGVQGWLNCGACRDADAASDTAELRAMYVSPEKWRSGVGAALWSQARMLLQESGYRDIVLWVLEANVAARQFYEREGFTLEQGTHKMLTYGSTELRALRYRLALHPPQPSGRPKLS